MHPPLSTPDSAIRAKARFASPRLPANRLLHAASDAAWARCVPHTSTNTANLPTCQPANPSRLGNQSSSVAHAWASERGLRVVGHRDSSRHTHPCPCNASADSCFCLALDSYPFPSIPSVFCPACFFQQTVRGCFPDIVGSCHYKILRLSYGTCRGYLLCYDIRSRRFLDWRGASQRLTRFPPSSLGCYIPCTGMSSPSSVYYRPAALIPHG